MRVAQDRTLALKFKSSWMAVCLLQLPAPFAAGRSPVAPIISAVYVKKDVPHPSVALSAPKARAIALDSAYAMKPPTATLAKFAVGRSLPIPLRPLEAIVSRRQAGSPAAAPTTSWHAVAMMTAARWGIRPASLNNAVLTSFNPAA